MYLCVSNLTVWNDDAWWENWDKEMWDKEICDKEMWGERFLTSWLPVVESEMWDFVFIVSTI
jgi:hypothetical protein